MPIARPPRAPPTETATGTGSDGDRRALLRAGGIAAGLMVLPRVAQGRPGPIVATASGRVQGDFDGPIKVFKGIAYAASTAGAARFMPPREPAPWRGVRHATRYGDQSPRLDMNVLREEKISLDTSPRGEDCLRLNVWTPGLDGARKRPVMVWFHGGGYFGGSGGNVRYDGRHLTERQDVVLVTVNHRLNAFGFLYLGDLGGPAYASSGNLGMLDLIAALQWVRTNIAQFGGDPDNVTIFGQSGGGGKVTTLMAMPMARGLFHRAIAQSGVALRARTTDQASQTARALMRRAGLRPDQVDELKALPAARILAAMAAAAPGELNFGPVLDHLTLMHDPFDPVAPSESADVPLLLGSTLTESTFFPDTPLDPIDDQALRRFVRSNTHLDEEEAEALIAVYRKGYPDAANTRLAQLISTDNWQTVDVAAAAAAKSAIGRAPAYLYHFEKTTPVRGGLLGAPHTLEIPYVFDNVDLANSQILTGPVSQSRDLASRMSATWASFARTGQPEVPGGPPWRPYADQDRAVMVIDDEWRIVVDPHAEQRLAMAAVKAKTHYNGRG